MYVILKFKELPIHDHVVLKFEKKIQYTNIAHYFQAKCDDFTLEVTYEICMYISILIHIEMITEVYHSV